MNAIPHPVRGSHPAETARRVPVRLARRVGLALLLSASVLGVGALTAAASAVAAPPDGSANYTFRTLDDANDGTFNQLLGINDAGLISGYFGSGQTEHPNKGYRLAAPYGQGNYQNENFPGSAQTQVTGLDNIGVTVGFWVNKTGRNLGFYSLNGRQFHSVAFPTSNNAKPQFDQLLGVNDNDVAVGFYTDGHGVNHGFSYDILTHTFKTIAVSGDTNVTAAAVNNVGDVAGFATNGGGTVEAFLERADGKPTRLSFPGATATQAFGVNNGDEVVGDYTEGTGSNAATHGFVWVPGFGFETVNDPNGTASTTINGVNDHGALVGFYTDAGGHTDGLLATPEG